jgi:hypothetical protein
MNSELIVADPKRVDLVYRPDGAFYEAKPAVDTQVSCDADDHLMNRSVRVVLLSDLLLAAETRLSWQSPQTRPAGSANEV